MSTLMAKVASALSFAHLAGLPRSNAKAKSKADDGDDKKESPEPDDEDDEKAKSNDEDKNYAEDDDPDSQAESDDNEPEDGEKKDKAKKASADDDKKEDDEEKMQAGARRERARCAAIFASPAAARNVQLAAELAFNTDLSSKQAVAVLEKSPAARPAHPDRAARNPRVGSGAGAAPDEKQAVASRWDKHLQEASGKSGRR
jgi:hypothetical protein